MEAPENFPGYRSGSSVVDERESFVIFAMLEFEAGVEEMLIGREKGVSLHISVDECEIEFVGAVEHLGIDTSPTDHEDLFLA
jgi:hypothetical protein